MPRLLLVAVVLAAAGCGDTFVDPFLRGSSALSVYGVLEAGYANEPSTEQTLRVQSVRTNAEPPRSPDDPALAFQAEVITVDPLNGDSLRWTGRRTQFSDGTYGDLFSATFRPRPGSTYDLVVRRDDGRTATADISIPPSADGVPLGWERRGPREMIVERLAWEGFGLDQVTVLVEMSCGFGCGANVLLDGLPAVNLGDGRFAAEYDLVEARRLGCIETTPPPQGEVTFPCPPLTLDRVQVRARVLGPEWAFAADPTQTVFEGGYGFVGGSVRVETVYLPSAEATSEAGFAGT